MTVTASSSPQLVRRSASQRGIIGMVRVQKVTPLEGYHVRVSFTDGSELS